MGLTQRIARRRATANTRRRQVDLESVLGFAEGKKSILWLVEAAELPINFLASLDPGIREKIFSHSKSGQARINELFRLVQGRIVPRVAIETVAQQKDSMKRVRDARELLKAEGILILGHQGEEPKIAASRGYPVPKKGEMISISEAQIE